MINPDLIIKKALSKEEFSEGKKLFIEYADSLGIDLCFQNFNNEINHLQEMYSEPTGGLILAILNNKLIGVAGIRKFKNKDCELKRMYVKEEYRGSGTGRKILEFAIDLAKKLKYENIKLDTHESMKSAIKIYIDFGFEEIPSYRFNPNENVKYFELKL